MQSKANPLAKRKESPLSSNEPFLLSRALALSSSNSRGANLSPTRRPEIKWTLPAGGSSLSPSPSPSSSTYTSSHHETSIQQRKSRMLHQARTSAANKPFSPRLTSSFQEEPLPTRLNNTQNQLRFAVVVVVTSTRYIMLFIAHRTSQWFIDWAPEVELAPKNRVVVSVFAGLFWGGIVRAALLLQFRFVVETFQLQHDDFVEIF